MNAMQEAAVNLTRHGFAVIPLLPKSKRPPYREWQTKWTRDPEQARRLWSGNSDYGVGIICGAPSGGLKVIDLDEHGIDGNKERAAWEAVHGHFPETVTARSGSGGKHLYYRMKQEFKTSINGDIGVDIKSTGIIVAPPSIHPNGNPYEWIVSPDDMDVAEADNSVQGFIEYILKRRKAAAEPAHVHGGGGYLGSYEGRYIEPQIVHEGGRNDALFAYGCHLRGSGKLYSDSEIADMMRRFNQEQCDPPDNNTKQVEDTIRSVLSHPAGHSAAYDAAHKNTEYMSVSDLCKRFGIKERR